MTRGAPTDDSNRNGGRERSLLLRRDGHTQLVYKHAISTVLPGRAVNFQASEPGEQA